MGVWDVERWLDEELDPRQLDWWLAYDALEPFGAERDDLRSGLLGATLGNLWISDGMPLEPSHFMPFSKRRRPRPQSATVQIAIAHTLAAAQNGKG